MNGEIPILLTTLERVGFDAVLTRREKATAAVQEAAVEEAKARTLLQEVARDILLPRGLDPDGYKIQVLSRDGGVIRATPKVKEAAHAVPNVPEGSQGGQGGENVPGPELRGGGPGSPPAAPAADVQGPAGGDGAGPPAP